MLCQCTKDIPKGMVSHVEKPELQRTITGEPKGTTIILVRALIVIVVCLKPKIGSQGEPKVKENRTQR